MNEIYRKKIDVYESSKHVKQIINLSDSLSVNQKDEQLQEILQKAANHLEQAIQGSRPRQAFPAAYKHKFPFNLGKRVQGIVLRFFNLIFFDQRKVNKDLINANQCLIDTITVLNCKSLKEIELLKLDLEIIKRKISDDKKK